jgi:hypothetical protein
MGTPELLEHQQCDQYKRDDDSVKKGHDAVLPQVRAAMHELGRRRL